MDERVRLAHLSEAPHRPQLLPGADYLERST
jgi:hypothetical protein